MSTRAAATGEITWRLPGRFSRDRQFMSKYFLARFAVLALLDTALVIWSPAWHGRLELTSWHLAVAVVGLYLGALSGVFIHNATHRSFRPRWMNRVMGELAGAQQLYGFDGWKLGHLIHHRFADVEGLDPHSPSEHRNMFVYAIATVFNVSGGLVRFHRITWGKSSVFELILGISTYLAAIVAQAAFWYLLLGPTWFTALYLPSLLGAFAFFGHLNFLAHRPNERGEYVVMNLTRGKFAVLNLLLFGVYYHKNHHEVASIFNPAKLKTAAVEEAGRRVEAVALG